MAVTIIIPCYNQAQFLSDAIDSCLNQKTSHKIEIIVVDDGSPDNTKEICQKYKDKVKYIYQKNKGLSGARNTGIKHAKYNYIITLDSDDKIHHEFVEKTMSRINQFDIVSTYLTTFGANERSWGSENLHPRYEDFINRNNINCCSLFTKSMWKELNGYDEKMKDGFEDWDFWTRATKKKYKVCIIPEYLFFYRKHVGSSMFSEAMKKREQIINYMKIKYSPNKRLIDVVYVLGNGSINSNNEILFSLRSLQKYCTGYRDVHVIGHRPKFLKNIKHTQFIEGNIKAINILLKIKQACLNKDITDDFLFMNDDHFFCKEVDINNMSYYFDQNEMYKILRERKKIDTYRRIIEDTIETFTSLIFFDVHKPMIINKAKFLNMCENINFKKFYNGLLVKSSYCNFNNIKGVPCKDMVLREKLTYNEIIDILKNESIFAITDDAINESLIKFFTTFYPIESQFET
jgi:glycosyltransferase involved in cell wall biosynthesis